MKDYTNNLKLTYQDYAKLQTAYEDSKTMLNKLWNMLDGNMFARYLQAQHDYVMLLDRYAKEKEEWESLDFQSNYTIKQYQEWFKANKRELRKLRKEGRISGVPR